MIPLEINWFTYLKQYSVIPQTQRWENPTKNERMYQELSELLTTDSAAGKENAIADKLTEKMEALGFTVTGDNEGETFGGE